VSTLTCLAWETLQQQRYRPHSDQDHVTTQAPPLRQNRNNIGGLNVYVVRKMSAKFGLQASNVEFSTQTEELTSIPAEFYVLLTVHLITIFINKQNDTQFFFLYLFTPILYMFRATVTGHLHRVTYTRGRIDTFHSPDDEHLVARNM